jgi:hypothetical protein
MKAPIAQAGGEAASPPGCAFFFFLGLEIVKCILKKLGFWRGSDLSMLSSSLDLTPPPFLIFLFS